MSPKRKRRRASMEAAEPQESSWSPAEGMAQFRQQQKIDRSFRSRYVEGLSFTPDHFQIEAMDALEAGHSVLVAAPTVLGRQLSANLPSRFRFRRVRAPSTQHRLRRYQIRSLLIFRSAMVKHALVY